MSAMIVEALDFLYRHPLIRLDLRSYFTLLTGFDYTKSPPLQQQFLLQPLLIVFADLHSLCKPSGPEHREDHSDRTVIAWSEDIVFGKFQILEYHSIEPSKPSFPIYEIQLCEGLQKDTLVSVLVHEILHAVFSLQSKTSIPFLHLSEFTNITFECFCGTEQVMELEDEEALCNAVGALYLEQQAAALRQRNSDVVSAVRHEICEFRHRRLMVGDIGATRHISSASTLVRSGWLRNCFRKRCTTNTAEGKKFNLLGMQAQYHGDR